MQFALEIRNEKVTLHPIMNDEIKVARQKPAALHFDSYDTCVRFDRHFIKIEILYEIVYDLLWKHTHMLEHARVGTDEGLYRNVRIVEVFSLNLYSISLMAIW